MAGRILIKRTPWGKKPDYPVEINYGHPLSKGLSAVYLMDRRDGDSLPNLIAASGYLPGTINPNATGWEPKNIGDTIKTDRRDTWNGDGIEFDTVSGENFLGGTGQLGFSLLFQFVNYAIGGTAGRPVMLKEADNNGIGLTSEKKLNFYASSGNRLTANTVLAGGRIYTIGFKHQKNVLTTFYVDGKNDGSNTQNFNMNDALDKLGDGDGGGYFSTNWVFLYIWNGRMLSDIDFAYISANPYQIFQPSRQVIPFTIPAGGTTFFESPVMISLGVPSITKQVGLVKPISALGVVTEVEQLSLSKSFTLTASTNVTFSQSLVFLESFPIIGSGLVALIKQVQKTLSITATVTPDITKDVAKPISIVATGVPTEVHGLAFIQTVSIIATGVLTTVVTFIAGVGAGIIVFIRKIAIRLGLGL